MSNIELLHFMDGRIHEIVAHRVAQRNGTLKGRKTTSFRVVSSFSGYRRRRGRAVFKGRWGYVKKLKSPLVKGCVEKYLIFVGNCSYVIVMKYWFAVRLILLPRVYKWWLQCSSKVVDYHELWVIQQSRTLPYSFRPGRRSSCPLSVGGGSSEIHQSSNSLQD